MSSYVPPQHGAWAFLGLPLVLGAVVTPWTPLLVLLAVAWVAAYPWSYAAFGLVRARRPQRFRAPFLVWSAVVLPASAVLLAWRPWLVWVGIGYLALFAVNLHYARRNDERALTNDAVFVAECAAMVAVTWAVGAGARSWAPPGLDAVPAHVWVLVIVCALVLLGSTLHVKSLIRERRDPRFARAARVLAVACVPA
ncbi:MAG: YwiC-like family protein, partial [Actinomycetales bacterium]|nr:YwiC-like family protein [Actinomycetales bacterium]